MEKGFRKKFIRPTILDDIHNVFNKYPYDGGIFKEMIQNAEDAEAENITFILDSRTFNAKAKYETPGQASLQILPSIISFNDARITEEDWQGIQSIGLSNKDKKAYKVGKFGIGMKSLFHITDCIQIISGEDVLYLDPLTTHFGDEIEHYNLGEMLSKCPEKKKELKEATQLIRNYNTNYDQDYPFTMFRLPLRKQSSRISNRVLSDSDAAKLFEELIEDGSNNLLFLKHLKSIRLYTLSNKTSSLIYKIDISSTENVEKQRRVYRQNLENSQPFKISYNLLFTIQHFDKIEKQEYVVVIQQNSDNSDIKRLSNKLHYQPCMGLAVPLIHSLSGAGALFTFLPICSNMELPIHIHGYFALNDSRSGLKFSNKLGDDDSQWNVLLITNLLPNVYSQLLASLSDYKTIDEIVDFLPPKHSGNIFWSKCSDYVLSTLLECKFMEGSIDKTSPKDPLFIIDDEYAKFKIEILDMANENYVLLKKATLQKLQTAFSPSFGKEVCIEKSILKLQARSTWSMISNETKSGILEYLLNFNLDVSNLKLIPLIQYPRYGEKYTEFKKSTMNIIYFPSQNLEIILKDAQIPFIDKSTLTRLCIEHLKEVAKKKKVPTATLR